MRKLSPDQVSLLLWLSQQNQRARFAGLIPWRVSGSPCKRAARSRSLRRLECRGLILRVNLRSGMGPARNFGQRKSATDPHTRTTHIRLLPAGIETANRLTNGKSYLLTGSEAGEIV